MMIGEKCYILFLLRLSCQRALQSRAAGLLVWGPLFPQGPQSHPPSPGGPGPTVELPPVTFPPWTAKSGETLCMFLHGLRVANETSPNFKCWKHRQPFKLKSNRQPALLTPAQNTRSRTRQPWSLHGSWGASLLYCFLTLKHHIRMTLVQGRNLNVFIGTHCFWHNVLVWPFMPK